MGLEGLAVIIFFAFLWVVLGVGEWFNKVSGRQDRANAKYYEDEKERWREIRREVHGESEAVEDDKNT